MVITGGRLNKGVIPPKHYPGFPETKKPHENFRLLFLLLRFKAIPQSQIAQIHGVNSVHVS
jgi:hypothetical protein